jgi:hypothetical protein
VSDSFDLPDFGFEGPPDLSPEPVTPVFDTQYTPSQGRGEPGRACYTCGTPFHTWVGSVTLRDFLTLCRLCTHFLER